MTDSSCDVVIVRHGQTIWNEQRILQGQADSPLTELGRKQAQCLADGLVGEAFAAVYSSDLGRAMETAAIVARRLKMEAVPEPALRERDFACFQGLTWAQIERKFPDLHRQYWEDPSFAPPGGEPAAQVRDRVIACINRLASQHTDRQILLITHGEVLMNVFKHAVRLHHQARRQFSLGNATINRFRISGDKWRLATWGQSDLAEDMRQDEDAA